ncbi:hypothetical protein MRB53_007942 [Persea americana]|uniref:Uncharacterized protein n=1 Tax=Persea americana TaxID=3435 RepID=A0ACC2MKC4_PERAE|nr:hypothetical protein MRB53_007942 [Persea americana]
MYDGEDQNLDNHYSTVAQRMGVYTADDYVDMLEFFVKRWKRFQVGFPADKAYEALSMKFGEQKFFLENSESSVARAISSHRFSPDSKRSLLAPISITRYLQNNSLSGALPQGLLKKNLILKFLLLPSHLGTEI